MSKYFSSVELQCKCGLCGGLSSLVRPELYALLDAIREKAGRPLSISSGLRCQKHPIEAKKSKPGSHCSGYAADIKVSNGIERMQLVRIAIELGVARIGVAEGFVHIDVHPTFPQNVMWTY